MDDTAFIDKYPCLEKAQQAAIAARENAYAPYSKFKVGAALKLKGIEAVVAGCNVENASYGATICAERGAILSACAAYGKPDIEFIVIVTSEVEATVPCALCLQVLAEFCQPDTPVFSSNLENITGKWNFRDLLPKPFVNFEGS